MTPLFQFFMWFLTVTGCRRRLALALVEAEGLTLLPAGWMMFDPALADEIGINKAVILQKVDGWIQSNVKRHHNIIRGIAWSYNTIPNWQKEFCWLTKNYVGELLRQLERDGRLVSDFLAAKPQDRTKYYSTQIGLWDSENPILREQKVVDDSSIENPSKANPSIGKPKTTPATARARKPLSSGAVAVFPTFQNGGDPLERKAETPEAHDWRGVDESDHALEESPGKADVKAPFPVPAGFPQVEPPSPAEDDATEPDAPPEEETASDGDMQSHRLPEWASLLNGLDAEIAGWLECDCARLKAWCEFAPTRKLGGGYVRIQMRIAGNWPPIANPIAQSYVSGSFADYILH